MSYRNLKKALKLAWKCKFYTVSEGKSKETIEAAEQILGLSFSPQCRMFYEQYGYLSFYGCEIFGIDPYDISEILEGNLVAYALNEREKYGLPTEWIPFYSFGDGNIACFDYSSLNSENEPRVIKTHFNGSKYLINETVAEDFGEFLLKTVNESLASSKILYL